VDLDNKWR